MVLGDVLELHFSEALQDLLALSLLKEETFASMVLSREGKPSNTTDLAEDQGPLGASSLWWETELLFFGAFPELTKVFPFSGDTLAKITGVLNLSRNRCMGVEVF